MSLSSLYTQPIKIAIDGLYVLAEANLEVNFDAEQEANELYDARMKEVHKVEELQKAREEYGEVNVDVSISVLESLPL